MSKKQANHNQIWWQWKGIVVILSTLVCCKAKILYIERYRSEVTHLMCSSCFWFILSLDASILDKQKPNRSWAFSIKQKLEWIKFSIPQSFSAVANLRYDFFQGETVSQTNFLDELPCRTLNRSHRSPPQCQSCSVQHKSCARSKNVHLAQCLSTLDDSD